MKLIIDIPENAKQAFDNAESNDLKGGYYDHGGIIGKAIQNGMLLDDVKVEIEALPKTYPFVNHIDAYVKEDDVLQILDNIDKAESEDKE